ncbi:biopolymer transporter ExbD [Hanstruepera flava]|uniref:biopolymer transporter ExbD n=1 Tax=Hanstruepera flava TaxID=2930218 RepID=UPI002027E411|nr:biopolymer transporter ExbD [Hanstruepera flava]
MNYSKLSFLFLICTCSIYSQQYSDIELPNIDTKQKYLVIPYHSIFINRDNQVYFGDEEISIHEVKEKIYGSYYKHPGYGKITTNPLGVHLFADQNADYKIIDEIKSEIAQTNCNKKIFYRTNLEMTNISKMYGIKYMLPNSFFKFTPPNRIRTKKELDDLNENKERNKQLGFPEVPDVNSPELIVTSPATVIYSIQEEVIKEFFENKKVIFIEIGSNYIEHNNIKYSILEVDNLKNFFNDFEVIIYTYKNDLKYNDYLKYLNSIIPIEKSLPNTKFIEYSAKMRLLHQKSNIDLRNIIHH